MDGLFVTNAKINKKLKIVCNLYWLHAV